jgi:hypothetical protein
LFILSSSKDKEKTSAERPGNFMDNIKPALTVSQFIKVNELANFRIQNY